MVAALQYPGLFSAAAWESLCPVDKLHFWGSPLWIPQNHVEIQEANFILVTLKEKKKKKSLEIKKRKDKGTFTENKLFGGLLSLPLHYQM